MHDEHTSSARRDGPGHLPLDRGVRDAVSDVLIRYATGIDSRDWDVFRSCFTEDCDLDYGDIGHWHSLDDATKWMADTHEPLGPTLHRITNIAIVAEGEGLHARSAVHAVLAMPGGSGTVHAYGRYEDELVASAGGWRITRRRFVSVATEFHAPTIHPGSVPQESAPG